ncbi:VapC-type toxin [Ignicoccus pacificus DSM 13166]|uniref:VapC-type toxin n=1 Tax=Ignicoccus pacificus DSM 13166 TaxID=940294 RepID=A0A977K9T1_9CREN|nr:VapC-type toxin [Ignicoccus pacificus DSM 13166]
MRGSKVTLDASVLIEIALGKPDVIDYVLNNYDLLYASRLSLVETYYVICRGLGREEAEKRISLISKALSIVEAEKVWKEVGECKCKYPISLGDCFTLSTSKYLNSEALFLKREKEIEKVLSQLKQEFRIAFIYY